MNKTQKILLISFCALFVLLLVALLVAVSVSIATNGMQGLVGELFGDVYYVSQLFEIFSSGPLSEIKLPEEAVTESPTVEVLQTVSEEQTTQSEEEIMDMLFDRGGKMHKPSYEDYLKIGEGMTVVEIVEILGKPHGWDAGAGQRYFGWSLDNGDTVWIQLTMQKDDGPDWDGLFTENYGGAVALSIRYSGSESNEFGK